MSNLQPAHRGYRYQDLATAYVLVRAVVEGYHRVIVDRKEVKDDRIDDIEVVIAGRRIRRQIKSSDNPMRQLGHMDFVGEMSSLRIDRLVLTHVRAGTTPADEYRLCATWQPPGESDPLYDFLKPINAEATVVGLPSRHFRLDADHIWPEDADPVWAPLIEYGKPIAEFGRDDLITFCERFVIELSLPTASTTLQEPGPLENMLINELSEHVGIGRYPNQGRSPADVAALAVSLATLARTQGAALTPADVERELGIRTDFGRVAQAFPLDEALYHDRPEFRETIRIAALDGNHQLVIAPPGAGKSWELTRLSEELKATGAIVARHYCFLEPGDEEVERRVTTDVFFGNLLAELIDAAPELLGASEARFAAGLPELEQTLVKAVTLGPPVILVVDGLDHIARVRARASSLADDDTDIVERLATLKVPEGVSIVIGSQPGNHLDPIRTRWNTELIERPLPPWLSNDIVALAEQHGVVPALESAMITEADGVKNVFELIASRADGNPLYARYLSRGLIAGLRNGTIASPIDWLSEAPAIAGDVAVYYAHLYSAASAQAQAVADLIGVIDFAVTETELKEILPSIVRGWAASALAYLNPVLTVVTSQGGIRVFHESFRRFMIEELSRRGRSLADVLEPVIAWLEKRGFYRDAKSYRFLLPALRRAGRGSDVLAQVDVAFVSDSVAHAHPLDAIQRNLTLAADVAARIRDWPALIRCVELHLSAHICFDESQNEWHGFWVAYLELFGASALAERLLFDGRPTQSRSNGLLACSLIDDAGSTAPWSEYLLLPDDSSNDESSIYGDENGELTHNERVTLAILHGRLRLGQSLRIIRRLLIYLVGGGDDILFVRACAQRLARMIDPTLVERIAQRADPTRRGGALLTRRAATLLRLGVADEYARRGQNDAAANAATLALGDADLPEIAAACIDLGAPIDAAIQVAMEPSSIPIAVGPDTRLDNAADVRKWVASVRLLGNDTLTLEKEVKRVDGVGWYRCWLRFVLRLAIVERALQAGESANVVEAFTELARDLHPFTGEPRACDLHVIRYVIRETFEWGLSLLRTEHQWREALTILSTVSEQTASSLFREDGGPLPTGILLEVLLPYANDPIGGSHVYALVERAVARRDLAGTFYQTHAEFSMRLVRARIAGGDITGARQAWKQVGIFLSSYGWHKEITALDVIESTPALRAVSQQLSLEAIADAQQLSEGLVAHTDGRSTKHAPNLWFRSLATVSPMIAAGLLARTVAEGDGTGGWPIADAIRDLAAQVVGIADPALVNAILGTVRFNVESEDMSAKTADARLAPIVGLADSDRPLASDAIRRVAAEIGDDGRRHIDKAVGRLESTARELGLPVPHIDHDSTRVVETQSTGLTGHKALHARHGDSWRILSFPVNPTFVELLVGLRTVAQNKRWNDPSVWDDTIHSLSYHIGQMIDDGRRDDAVRLLRFFARDMGLDYSERVHPLAKLGPILENAGYHEVAAIASALAYTATRGGGGYLRFGDQTHSHIIQRAVALDSDASFQVIADEISYAVRVSKYTVGIPRHLVERLAELGNGHEAEKVWREAFAVVAHRLPLPPSHGRFARLDLNDLPDWNVDEALIALLLARLCNPQLPQKIASLSGILYAIQRRPDDVIRPLQWWMTRNAHVSSILLVLDVLLHSEPGNFPVSRRLSEVLTGYATSGLWGAQRLALMLLERANLPIPTVPPKSLDVVVSAGQLTSRQRQALLSTDLGDTLAFIKGLWPELPDIIIPQLHSLATSKAYEHQFRARYELAYGHDDKLFPKAPVFMWQTELFIDVFHDQLSNLRTQLWATGQWTLGAEDELIPLVLPDTKLHLGIAASRTARPAWPDPNSFTNGESVLEVLGSDDPQFTGWTRIAMLEDQYVLNRDQSHGRPHELVRLHAGVVAVPLGQTIPPNAFPFWRGATDDLWVEAALPTLLPQLRLGPIIGIALHSDWLGEVRVLVPSEELITHLALEPPGYGAPIIWTDRTGVPALALRTWRVRNKDVSLAEPIEYEGMDLIVRPDVAARLLELYATPLRELRRIVRESLVHDE